LRQSKELETTLRSTVALALVIAMVNP
jgi:hypothetical protein